ncbi:tetratricopeptide repeat protein [Telluribacter sp.]|jgi:tetratricopeptide (TPR) repeat protein|uniref:tetratricopeptide repeat protein n=1 Tax=Telluribacter sp. TaxID=1978767 RepID=UPI002E0E032C|nr:tetratricopeptide repeat protein [Telluribacter sp.]
MNTKLKTMFGALLLSALTLATVVAQTPEEGFAQLEAERPNDAKAIFTKLAEGSPTPESYYNLGYFYVRNKQLDEAQKAFEKGLSLDDKSYLNQVGLATVALGKGDKAKAQELIALAEKKTRGKDAQVLYRAGEAYTLFEKNNDPAEAIRLLDAAIKRDKSLADAYIAKGDALMLRNEGGPAVTAYEYALMAKPGYSLANNRIGQVYLRGKAYNQALDFYKKAIDDNPNFGPAYKDLAELYFFARQYKRAAENFDLYLQKSGNTDPKMVLRAAQFAFTADDYTKALELLDSVKGKLDDTILKRMYGWAYYKTNDMEQAIKNLEEFIEKYPKEKDEEGKAKQLVPDDYKYLGRAYNKMTTSGKEYDSTGMQYILKGADLDTSATEAATTYKEVAGLYYKEKEYDKAASTFKKGIALDTAKASPNDYYYLGLSYYQEAANTKQDSSTTMDSAQVAQTKFNTYLQADSVFAKVTEKLPDWPFGYYWRGSALYNAHGPQANLEQGISVPHYQKFIEVAEQKGDVAKSFLKQAYQYMAFYHQTITKDEEKAKTYWTKLLEVDPANQPAKDALGIAETATTPAKGTTTPKQK